MYCRATNHDIEGCPTLLGKIEEKRNQKNKNVQWIFAEAKDDGRNINIGMCGGTKTGPSAVSQVPSQHKWLKKNTETKK
jgi:hypothetical protein